MVCATFYPMNNPRAVQCTSLYKELSKRGYEVTLCLPMQRKIYCPGEVTELLKEPGLQEKAFIKNYSKAKKIISGFVCYFIGQKSIYLDYPWMKSNINLKDYKAVIAIAAPFYPIALTARLLKKNHIRAICDNGDPFYNPKQHSIFVKRLQINSFKQFDYINFPIEDARKYYIQYADPKKLTVIPQGRDFEDVTLKEYKKNDIPTCAYAGCFFEDIRNPEPFLNMLLTVDRPFKVIFYTETTGDVYEKILKDYQKKLEGKLEIRRFVPRKECIYELSGMDFLINYQNMSSVQAPSKLIDYTLSKRPIYSVRQDKVDRNTFEEFLDGNYQKQTIVDISQYDIRNVAEKYIDLIERDEMLLYGESNR